MKYIVVSLLFIFGSVAISNAEISISNSVMNDISQSYGFYLGQKQSLDKIAADFPDLAAKAKLAELEFFVKFGISLNAIDAQATTASKAEWTKIKASLSSQVSENLKSRQITLTEAEDFIKLVSSRAEGNLPSPIIETLLIFNPRFQKRPEVEFFEGFTKTYKNDGSGKSKGVAFNLIAPISWKAIDGNRPNIAVKFINENGRGLNTFLVLINEIPNEPGQGITWDDIKEILDPTIISQMVPKGASITASGLYSLENLPGYWVNYNMNVLRGKISINTNAQVYTVFHKNRMIQMQGFSPIEVDNVKIPDVSFEKYQPLFDLIANSLMIPELYSVEN